MGLEFDYVQLAGQPAPGEKEAWNADALMEGVRVGTGRGDFLAALEDRVKAEEMQWAPLLQLHFPDPLDDYLNKVLVETGQRFFKKAPVDAPGYADLAVRRRELLTQRLEARNNIGEDRLQGRRAWNVRRSFSRRSASHRRRQPFSLAWKRGDLAATFRWSRFLGGRRWEPRRQTTGRCRRHFPRRRRGRTSGPSQEHKEAWGRRFSKAVQSGGLRPATS